MCSYSSQATAALFSLCPATVTASSVLVPTLLACPWSGNTAASMKVREGDKGKDTAPTVMHCRQMSAAKLSSLSPSTSQWYSEVLWFLHLRKILTEEVFPVWHGVPWEKKTHWSCSAALTHRGYQERVQWAWCKPANPSTRQPRDFPGHRQHLQQQL